MRFALPAIQAGGAGHFAAHLFFSCTARLAYWVERKKRENGWT
jgi:hypothetical protein